MSSVETARVSELINAGEPRAAIAVAQTVDITQPNISADFFFQLGLAHCLIQEDRVAEQYFERARHCPGYTGEVMEGDVLRDLALVKIRRHEIEDVGSLLEASRLLHLSDANRTAANSMAGARYLYVRGDYQYACDAHARADLIWRSIPDADEQWVKNNNFHWLRASVRADRLDRFRLYLRVLRLEQRRDRKLAALVMLCLGKRGVDRVDARELRASIS